MSILGFLLSIIIIFFDFKLFLEIELISLNSCSYVLLFFFDWISIIFFFVVTLISSIVIYYSKSYMLGEINIERFIYLILLFILSIVLLIFRLNLISILLGWDGLGLVSYCLVIFYQNSKSFNSGILTVLRNRIGDVILLIAISWIINLGSWNFIFYLNIIKSEEVIIIILFLVIIAAITKRAQIPFSAWLPAAIAAPTPVSSLVHSSTLVTAGVYLIIRFEELIRNRLFREILLLFSRLTMLIAGLRANFEFDLKKIIALSTLRQLGLIIRILCLGYKNIAFFHLRTHAIFKALLFICAGLIIHNIKNNQDIRCMGGLRIFIPLVSINFNVSNLALCGFPFLAGFYSKDLILEIVLFSNFNIIIFFFFFFFFFFIFFYYLFFIYFSLLKEINFKKIFLLEDKDKIIIMSIFLLILISIFRGRILNWLIIPFYNFIYLSKFIKLIVLIFIFMGLFIGIIISKINYLINNLLILRIYFYLGLIWFIPNLSIYGLNYFILDFRLKIDKIIDLGWLEKIGSINLYKRFMSYRKISYYFFFNSIKLFVFFFFLFI